MTDNQTVGNGADAGATEEPTSQVSQQAQTPIEGNVTQLLTGFGEELKGLRQELRGLQGRQDRTTNQFSDFQKRLARMNQYKEQYGMSDEEAFAEMAEDDASSKWRQTIEQKLDQLAERLSSGGNANSAQQGVAKVFEAVGLDLRDPRVAVALGKHYDNDDQVELAAYRLARELSKSPNPTNAQGASLQGAPNSVGLTPQQVEEKSIQLQRLYDNYDKNAPQILAIEKELEAHWAKSK